MFELQFIIQFLKAASADYRYGNGEVFPSDDGTLVRRFGNKILMRREMLAKSGHIHFRAILPGGHWELLFVYHHGTFL